jgi:hypothetical protein
MPPSWSRAYWTDDAPFEHMDDARFEIRAFDTRFFEIYAPEASFLSALADRYGGTIELA